MLCSYFVKLCDTAIAYYYRMAKRLLVKATALKFRGYLAMGALQHLHVFKIDTYITDRPSHLILGALIRVLSRSNIFLNGHNTFIHL